MDSVDLEVLKNGVHWQQQGHRVLLVTVVRTWGSSPRPEGAMLAVRDDGLVVGSVSGGCIEDDIIDRVREHYGIEVEVYAPDAGELEGMVRRNGVNLFRQSVPQRLLCCDIRKVRPLVKVLHDSFGVQRGWMTTVHAYTNDQNLLDLPHKDIRRARAAALSIIPTTTGAATAVGEVLPELKGKLDGISMRVPTPNVSVVDLVALLAKKATADEVNAALKTAAAGPMKGILAVSDDPLVSIDFRGNAHSSIVDSAYTKVMDGDFVKVMAWYDNEWGYSTRCVDLLKKVAAAL